MLPGRWDDRLSWRNINDAAVSTADEIAAGPASTTNDAAGTVSAGVWRCGCLAFLPSIAKRRPSKPNSGAF